jgi:hypothetical protein
MCWSPNGETRDVAVVVSRRLPWLYRCLFVMYLLLLLQPRDAPLGVSRWTAPVKEGG